LNKVCARCKVAKDTSEFNKKSSAKDGLSHYCKPCNKEFSSAWRKDNIEYARSKENEYSALNREKKRVQSKEWRTNNLQKSREGSLRWARENKGVKLAANAAREKHIKIRTPKWANIQAIKDIYELAVFVSEEMGEAYHVDHVIPLRGKLVSGLHIETNLQIIKAVDNLSKNNKFEIKE
jgi:hypothetical protein